MDDNKTRILKIICITCAVIPVIVLIFMLLVLLIYKFDIKKILEDNNKFKQDIQEIDDSFRSDAIKLYKQSIKEFDFDKYSNLEYNAMFCKSSNSLDCMGVPEVLNFKKSLFNSDDISYLIEMNKYGFIKKFVFIGYKKARADQGYLLYNLKDCNDIGKANKSFNDFEIKVYNKNEYSKLMLSEGSFLDPDYMKNISKFKNEINSIVFNNDIDFGTIILLMFQKKRIEVF